MEENRILFWQHPRRTVITDDTLRLFKIVTTLYNSNITFTWHNIFSCTYNNTYKNSRIKRPILAVPICLQNSLFAYLRPCRRWEQSIWWISSTLSKSNTRVSSNTKFSRQRSIGCTPWRARSRRPQSTRKSSMAGCI